MIKREIKFRQPIRDRKGNFVEWFYWDEKISPAIQLNGTDTRSESEQFLGITDKNDVKLFEGDIYSVTRKNLITGKTFKHLELATYKTTEINKGDNLSQLIEWEIIGNTTQHKESLKSLQQEK